MVKFLKGLVDLAATVGTIVFLCFHVPSWSSELAPVFASHWNEWFVRVTAMTGLLLLASWVFPARLSRENSQKFWPVFLLLGVFGQMGAAAAAALMARYGVAFWWQAVVPMLCFGLNVIIALVMTLFGLVTAAYWAGSVVFDSFMKPIRWARRVSALIEADDQAKGLSRT